MSQTLDKSRGLCYIMSLRCKIGPTQHRTHIANSIRGRIVGSGRSHALLHNMKGAGRRSRSAPFLIQKSCYQAVPSKPPPCKEGRRGAAGVEPAANHAVRRGGESRLKNKWARSPPQKGCGVRLDAALSGASRTLTDAKCGAARAGATLARVYIKVAKHAKKTRRNLAN